MFMTVLEDPLEDKFLDYLEPYPEDFLFFMRIWRGERGRTTIILAMEDDEIHGAMSIHDGRHVRMHGSEEAVKSLLKALSMTKLEMRIPLEFSHLVEGKFSISDSVVLTQMLLRGGEEQLMMVKDTTSLRIEDSERIAALLRSSDEVCWQNISAKEIEPLFDDWEFHGILVEDRLVAVGSAYITKVGGNVGLIATHPDFRNMGLARSIVSSLLLKIFQRSPLATIHVLPDNLPAKHIYESVGFKDSRDFLFLRSG